MSKKDQKLITGEVPVQEPEKKEPLTLLQNLMATRERLVDKLDLIDEAIDLVQDCPTITEYNDKMMELQKIRT